MKKYRFSSILLALALMVSFCAVPALALDDPEPNCKAAIVVDGDYGDVLYSYHAYDKMYPASITKVMTSLLVLDAVSEGTLSLDQEITASASAVELPEGSSTSGIKAGEILTVEELLYCALVSSANEACNILAEAVSGSVSEFVKLMNTRAEELGMTGTHFVNPHGLHDEDHYTTAYDITLMARAAMEYETFRTIVATDKYTVPATNLSEERVLHTTNYLLSNAIIPGYTYSKAIGIKTGSTTPAGQCLVSAAVDTDGRTYYCVILGAETVTDETGSVTRYSFTESKRLLEWAFDNFERITLLDENSTDVIREVPVTLSDEVDYVLVQPVGSIEATMPKDYDPDQAELVIDLVETVEAPVTKGDVLGSITLIYDGVSYGTLEMVAADSVERSDFQYYMKTIRETLQKQWVRGLIIFFIILILILIIWLGVIRPRRKRRRRYRSSRSRRYRGRRR